MAIKYEVKKVVFGFDKTNTEKFVAQTKVLGLVKFDKLCEEVQKVSMAPRGVVKMVIDGLIRRPPHRPPARGPLCGLPPQPRHPAEQRQI